MGSIVSPWTALAQRGIHGTCSLRFLFRVEFVNSSGWLRSRHGVANMLTREASEVGVLVVEKVVLL